MRYAAKVSKEGKYVLAEFPDCPGCQTFAEPGQDIADVATEALVGWLEAHMVGREAPPRPKKHQGEFLWVDVPLLLEAKIALRWARLEAKMTQADVARAIGVSQPMIASAENPDENTSLETLQKIVAAFPGAHTDFSIRFESRRPAKRAPAMKVARRKAAAR
jgi:DNA-binding XRE family transcriptional regulator/predicted RNase H-like HicB family nuclease